MRGKKGTIERAFDLEAYRNRGERLYIIVDASPWGLGGVLQVEANLVEYFASPLTEADLKRFDLKLGDPAGQQVWESLGALAALRLWAPRRQNRRVRLTVKGDSTAMLTTVLHMKAGSQRLGLIAREGAWIRLNPHLNPTGGSYPRQCQ